MDSSPGQIALPKKKPSNLATSASSTSKSPRCVAYVRILGSSSSSRKWDSKRKEWARLVSSYPERVLEVFLSQGHTQMTALSHYLGLPSVQADKDAILEYVSGWA